MIFDYTTNWQLSKFVFPIFRQKHIGHSTIKKHTEKSVCFSCIFSNAELLEVTSQQASQTLAVTSLVTN